MLLSWVLLASIAALVTGRGIEVTSNQVGGVVHISNVSNDGSQTYSQWIVGDLICVIARNIVNGQEEILKECKRGNLGEFHPMTQEEELIIQKQIIRTEEEKRIMQETQRQMQNTMNSMHNQIQRSLQGMQAIMRKSMENAFGMFG